ncbi:UvrD-helicase domain-containing protein [Cytobacillus sp. Hm23]
MDCAIHHDRLIELDSEHRENLQRLYENSLRGEITCKDCGAEVRLYLGMSKQPHFYHKTTPCQNTMALSVQQSKEIEADNTINYVEQNGFRIPKSRTISSTVLEKQMIWQPAKTVKTTQTFKNDTTKEYVKYATNIQLDSLQWDAVKHTEGPLLILAGAGSGKTRVLTTRTLYMIKDKKVDPASMILVTFTTKAAKEMKQRLLSYGISSSTISRMVIGTFHSIFYKILLHHTPEQWQSDKLIKWEWQREQLVKQAGMEINLDEKQFAYDEALQKISYWKNTLLEPMDIKPADEWEEKLAFLYLRYEQLKQEKSLFDFDDMLVGCLRFFKNNDQLLKKYQQRFHYFLIDEFQDINKVQYKIIQLLSNHTKNLCVVGDDDQSIYAFRGSDPSFILHFSTDYPNCKTVILAENYRSTHHIVQSANKVISENSIRHQKNMLSQINNQHVPTVFYPYDEEEEATMIVTDLKEKIANGAEPNDFAIFYRTHSASRALFERLTQSSLPFTIEQDSESFYQRRTVKSLVAHLRLSLDPNNSNAIWDILTAQFLKQSIYQDLKAITILEDCSFVDGLAFLQNVQPFQKRKLQKIVPLFKTLANLQPIKAIEKIEQEMGFAEFVKKRGNEGNAIERGSDDVRDLKVVAKKFENLTQFVEHIDHMIAMNKEMKELSKRYSNSITLSTIHRAKGLEYKNVYVLGAVDGSLPHDYALESFRNGDIRILEEERRLLYVAMTRAQDSLYLSIPHMRRGKKAKRSRFLASIIK